MGAKSGCAKTKRRTAVMDLLLWTQEHLGRPSDDWGVHLWSVPRAAAAESLTGLGGTCTRCRGEERPGQSGSKNWA
ncbi:hypothetical protein NDU88_004765 [Pleurodeles waltl]|uniref:Uncharacterized protein n=1 Tax=Pleurodeles waltl TaxID=8319 RepID=A0AAV7LRZ9_PLEWA|nr:hypothetical protein NDU88_004765 [Pleurodeles waltl]